MNSNDIAAEVPPSSPPPAAPPSHVVVTITETVDNPPDQAVLEPPINAPRPSHHQHSEWFSLFMNFCFAGVGISLQLNRASGSGHLPISFQMASLGMVFALAAFVASTYLPRNVGGAWARMLENVGVFCGVTGFLIYITPSFSLCLQIIAWIIYVASLLAIIISRNFNVFNE